MNKFLCECGGNVVKTQPIGEYKCVVCNKRAAMNLSIMCFTLTTKQSIREAIKNKTLVWVK